MKKINSVFLIILSLAFAYCSAPLKRIEATNNDVIISKDGEILAKLNRVWEDKYITATGKAPIPPDQKNDEVGQAMAREVALTLCYENMYRQLGEVKFTSTTSVLNFVTDSYKRTEMNGLIRGAKIIEDRWDSEKKNYIISMELKQTELVKYIKEWVDDGTINPKDLDRWISAF